VVPPRPSPVLRVRELAARLLMFLAPTSQAIRDITTFHQLSRGLTITRLPHMLPTALPDTLRRAMPTHMRNT